MTLRVRREVDVMGVSIVTCMTEHAENMHGVTARSEPACYTPPPQNHVLKEDVKEKKEKYIYGFCQESI